MKDIIPSMQAWIDKQTPFGLARVINTWGSSPRPVGSAMIVSSSHEIAGSVSGGCVENAVIKSLEPHISHGTGEILHFGVSDEDAWEVGLSCGGKLEVLVQDFYGHKDGLFDQQIWSGFQQSIHDNKSCVLITRLSDGPIQNTLVLEDLTTVGHPMDEELLNLCQDTLGKRKNQVVEYAGSRYFVHIFPRKNQLLIIGAAHISADLVQLGKLFDFEVVVIDPRGIFSKNMQFPVAPDQIIEQYPAEVLKDFTLDNYTYAAILSHDPKIDDNALELLLPSGIGYIGVLGSRKTHQKRIERLKAMGFDEALIEEKIDAPIGVDIKAKTPKEIALSIMGKIIEVKNQFC